MKRVNTLLTIIIVGGLLITLTLLSISVHKTNYKLSDKIDSLETVKQTIIYEPRIVEIVPAISYYDGYYHYVVYIQNVDMTQVSDCYPDSAKTIEGLINGIEEYIAVREIQIMRGDYFIGDFKSIPFPQHLTENEGQYTNGLKIGY